MTVKPHTHPSLNCYKNHKCRCVGCRTIGTRYMRELRATHRKLPRSRKTVGLRLPAGPRQLSSEELTRLRRAVGLE